MKITLNLQGNYRQKVAIFGVTLFQKKGKIDQNFVIYNDKLEFVREIDVPGPVDVTVKLEGLVLKLIAVFNGFPIYTHSIPLGKVSNTGTFYLPPINAFNRGLLVENLEVNYKVED